MRKWFSYKQPTKRRNLKVTLSGPGIDSPHSFYFDPSVGGTVNLRTEIVNCDNPDGCDNKTPGIYTFEMVPN